MPSKAAWRDEEGQDGARMYRNLEMMSYIVLSKRHNLSGIHGTLKRLGVLDLEVYLNLRDIVLMIAESVAPPLNRFADTGRNGASRASRRGSGDCCRAARLPPLVERRTRGGSGPLSRRSGDRVEFAKKMLAEAPVPDLKRTEQNARIVIAPIFAAPWDIYHAIPVAIDHKGTASKKRIRPRSSSYFGVSSYTR